MRKLKRIDSDFERGYFCAVTVLLRECGHVTAEVRSLFSQGGDAMLADKEDIALFVDYGLIIDPLL